jgi:ribosomal protein S18 acetylase RimI-like enzyme
MKDILIKPLQSTQVNDFFNLFKTICTTDFKKWNKESKKLWFEETYTPEYWKDNIENRGFPVFVAYDKEKMVGYIMIEAIDYGVAYLGWMGVLEDYREQGIGSLLIEELENWCRDNDIHKIELDTQEEYLKIFYEKNGFNFEGTKKNSWQHLDNYMFGKEL